MLRHLPSESHRAICIVLDLWRANRSRHVSVRSEQQFSSRVVTVDALEQRVRNPATFTNSHMLYSRVFHLRRSRGEQTGDWF
jgi:transposase